MGNKRKEEEKYHAKLAKPAKAYLREKNLEEIAGRAKTAKDKKNYNTGKDFGGKIR